MSLLSIWKFLNVNRVSRMRTHFLAIKEQTKPTTKKAKQECAFFSRKFEQYYQRARIWIHTRHFLYLFLYASLVLNLFPYAAQFVQYIEVIKGFIGTTVILGLVVIVSLRINLHVELMNEMLTHMIVLYHHNPKRDTKKALAKIRKTL
ncbi:MAG: hypothetical protein OXR66_09425 [Candidatus Woesearchaeota archaeon]|nr:hypothetical protein [Candidatus Woesearchaeota archaeon]